MVIRFSVLCLSVSAVALASSHVPDVRQLVGTVDPPSQAAQAVTHHTATITPLPDRSQPLANATASELVTVSSPSTAQNNQALQVLLQGLALLLQREIATPKVAVDQRTLEADTLEQIQRQADRIYDRVGDSRTSLRSELTASGSFNDATLSGTTFVDGSIGIGTTEPKTKLQIVKDVDDVLSAALTQTAYGGGGHAAVVGERANGSLVAPSEAPGGSTLQTMVGRAHDGTSFREVGRVSVLAGDNFGADQIDGQISFLLRDNGSPNFAMTIKSSGNVGIGTRFPSAKLTTINTSTSTSFFVGDEENDATPFVIDADGNVGIGTTMPTAKLTVLEGSLGNVPKFIRTTSNASNVDFGTFKLLASKDNDMGDGFGASMIFTIQDDTSDEATIADIAGIRDGSDNSGALSFSTRLSGANNEQMRITAVGNVGIGTTSPSSRLSVSGDVTFAGLTGATGAGSLCLDSNNEVVFNSGTDACLPSLRETKHDIATLDLAALDVVNALDPVSFVYNQGDGRTRYGFIAEDTADIDVLLATYDSEGTISGIDDRSMIAVVVSAMQEMWEQVQANFERDDAQDEELQDIRDQNEHLRDRITALEAELNLDPPPEPVIETEPEETATTATSTPETATTTPSTNNASTTANTVDTDPAIPTPETSASSTEAIDDPETDNSQETTSTYTEDNPEETPETPSEPSDDAGIE